MGLTLYAGRVTACDYIIVGGGSAACVAAWRLVKEKGQRVLILERGPARAAGLAAFFLPMPAGCRIGPEDEAGAVVDARLKLRGIEGLRVIDASAMPFIPSGNTTAPVMAALAPRAIDFP